MMNKNVLFLSLFFLCSFASVKTPRVLPADYYGPTKTLWYIKADPKDYTRYSVTIDAKKEYKSYQLLDVKFVVDYRDFNGQLLKRETVNFFPPPDRNIMFDREDIISGGDSVTRWFKHPFSSSTKFTGVKLLFSWSKSGVNYIPDFDHKYTIDLDDNPSFGHASIDHFGNVQVERAH